MCSNLCLVLTTACLHRTHSLDAAGHCLCVPSPSPSNRTVLRPPQLGAPSHQQPPLPHPRPRMSNLRDLSLRPLFKSTILQLKTPVLLSSTAKAEPGSRKFTLVPWMSSTGEKNNSSDFYECLLCARKPLVYELHILL